jgi:outer membrane protein insertion porin family
VAATLASSDGRHGLTYECGWRNLADRAGTASRAVLAQSGDYLKSSVQYTFLLDRRDSAAAPSAGWALRSTSQLSGVGPSPAAGRFAKQTLSAQYVVALPEALRLPRASASVSVTAGLLLPWGGGGRQQPTLVADRFFLGGIGSLRGFKACGAGPTDVRRRAAPRPAPAEGGEAPAESSARVKRDALGGDLFAALMAAVSVPLPHPLFEAIGAHAQFFVNGGNTVPLAGAATREGLGGWGGPSARARACLPAGIGYRALRAARAARLLGR